MEPFILILSVALLIVAFLFLMTVIISVIMVSVASRALRGEAERQLDDAVKLLPGGDCGRCGYASCREYAEAMLQSGTAPDKCPELSSEAAASLAEAVEAMTRQTELPSSIRERKRFLRRFTKRANRDGTQEEEEW